MEQYAGFWRRMAAILIDVFLLSMLIALGLLAWSVITNAMPRWGSNAIYTTIAASLLAALALMVFLDARYQGTPGIHLMDCRIVDARSGLRMNMGQSMRRSISIPLSLLPALLGLLWISWDRRRQSFHDKLAGTVVIREDDSLKSLTELAREGR